jgi:hypothetical protein
VRLHGHAAVSGATAFAFAGVFAFATVVTGFAAALAFTGVCVFDVFICFFILLLLSFSFAAVIRHKMLKNGLDVR